MYGNHAIMTGWQKLFSSKDIQMLLTFGGHYNLYFWDTRLKILRLPNFNMLFQLVLTKFFKSKLFSCLPKVGHVIKSCKEPIPPVSQYHSQRFFVISNRPVMFIHVSDLLTYKSFNYWENYININYYIIVIILKFTCLVLQINFGEILSKCLAFSSVKRFQFWHFQQRKNKLDITTFHHSTFIQGRRRCMHTQTAWQPGWLWSNTFVKK